MVSIIDYGVGNLFSLKSSFETIGEKVIVTSDENSIMTSDRLLLPGVGAFKDAYIKLKESGMDEVLKDFIKTGKPLMGVCLGMQLLFDKSYEHEECVGLGLIKGEIRPLKETINQGLKIPHMGWNALKFKEFNGNERHPLFEKLADKPYVYFVHSLSAVNCSDNITAVTEYGAEITAAVAKDNILGCQFHPEKSGETGLEILKSFCAM